VLLVFSSLRKQELKMRFVLGLLLGCIRGKKPLLAATLTVIAVVCFIVLPAIALSQLALSVRRMLPCLHWALFLYRRTSAQVCHASMTSRFVTIFTSTFLNMIMIPALYLKYGRAEVPSPTRDYPHGRELASSGDLR
jgi:hypothetical protein